MQSFSFYYSSNALENLDISEINSSKGILVQIFSGVCNKTFINSVIKKINFTFPSAIIIGATTDGEIMGEHVTSSEVVVSITTFENTTIKEVSYSNMNRQDSYYIGYKLAKDNVDSNSKVIIAFSDGLNTNAEDFINGINEINSDIVIAGGLAGDNAEFKKTYVFTKNGVIEFGLVAVILSSDELSVVNDFRYDWIPIGKKLTVTSSKNSRIYTIDNKVAAEVYREYLGDNAYEMLPKTGVEFPLIRIDNKKYITRSVLQKHDDGSLSYAGNIKEGDQYQFGYANQDVILDNATNLPKEYIETNIEAIFIYSCMARRRFMGKNIVLEIQPFAKLSNVSGFFTYGEFFQNKNTSQALQQTMTTLALSENPTKKKGSLNDFAKENINCNYREHLCSMTALSHLIRVSSQELDMLHQSIHKTNQQLLNGGPVVSVTFDLLSLSLVYISSNVKKFFGYEEKDLLGNINKLYPFIYKKDQKLVYKRVEGFLISESESIELEFRFKTKDKRLSYIQCYITKQKNSNGYVEKLYGYIIDITEKKYSEEKIKYLAFHDTLTGLPNRTSFENTLNLEIKQSKIDGTVGAVLLLDLTRFKSINDIYGHTLGDVIIKKVVKRIQNAIKKEDIVARLVGDEFAILCKNLNHYTLKEDILLLGKRLFELLEQPFALGDNVIHISTNIGVAIYSYGKRSDDNGDDILKYADMALHYVKKDTENYIMFFSSMIKDSITEGSNLEKNLRYALENDEFLLVYQPQVDLLTNEVVGAEALIRWVHKNSERISPINFIPAAERSGLILLIGDWVLKNVCKKIKYLQDENRLPSSFKKIAVNISSLQFKQKEFVKNTKKIIEECEIDPSLLDFELTEGVLIENIDETISKIKALKEIGIKFSIDDFGTGYSSLTYLKRFPVDTIKIDKSFISQMHEDSDDAILTETIIQMSKNLNLSVVAEGVEREEHVDFLQEKGCDIYQGYYFSKPVDFDTFETLLLELQRS
jgi:diguanylate cyclase (GGDEF)-like protein/PAS domain S-box-containing protein